MTGDATDCWACGAAIPDDQDPRIERSCAECGEDLWQGPEVDEEPDPDYLLGEFPVWGPT